jgi:DTW domain-containing protein YfiP
LQHCLCSEVPAVTTRTRVVIVRHHLEIFRASNTGRLAHLALPNSEIIDVGGGRARVEVGAGVGARETARPHPDDGEHGGTLGSAKLPALDGAWLLFPAGPETPVPVEPPPKALVVLDATWSQARRMFRKISALRGLPILRLAEAPMPSARLRESPAPGKVSTIEAIARALRVLEGDASATPLERLFELAVARAAQSGRQMR